MVSHDFSFYPLADLCTSYVCAERSIATFAHTYRIIGERKHDDGQRNSS